MTSSTKPEVHNEFRFRHRKTEPRPRIIENFVNFGRVVFGDRLQNGSTYAIGPLSVCVTVCLVTLAYCGQTVGLINVPRGTEVGLGADHIVLDGDSALPRKGAQQPRPTIRPVSIAAKRSPISATAKLLLRYT